MRRGEIYRVYRGSGHDKKDSRLFVVVSRQVLIDSQFSTVICAPIYSQHDGLTTQVFLDQEDGVKKTSSIHCDELISIPKSKLTHFIATLRDGRLVQLKKALAIALST